MQLYTVVLEKKHMISTFDAKGKKTGERMESIKQTINDLPHSTAMMYKSKDALSVTITPQNMSDFGAKSGRSDRRDITQRSARREAAPITTTKKAPAARPTTTVQQAAATGDMSAAINAKD